LAKLLQGSVIFCLLLFAIAAPHSIAAAQVVWLVGIVLWVARLAIPPRLRLFRTPVDYALLGFFILTGITAFLSYEPMVSIGKLRGAALFTIVYFVAENVPSHRTIRTLALVLIGSCMINVL